MDIMKIMSMMKKRVFFILMLWLLIAAFPLKAFSSTQVREEFLHNGLKVLILENHKAPTATFQIWYRVGSASDPLGRTGISHLLEHMMFKGTKKYGPKTFSQTIKRAGGRDNAFTSKDYTGYFQLLASGRIDLSIELEADRMTNLLLQENEVLSERDVVKEERRLRYEDDPQSSVYEEVLAAAFKSHPYRRPVIGWMADLNSITQQDLLEHYRKYYAPNNSVIIVVGDVNPDTVMEKITKAFDVIPTGPEIRSFGMSEAPQTGERRVYVKKEAELPYILSVFKVPTIPHADSYALDVLSTILSEGKSSRLYNSLVYDKKIALSAWAAYDGISKGPGIFYLGGTASPGKTAEILENGLLEEIEKLKKEPPTEREVLKAKNQAEASFIMEQDSIYMQAKTLGTFELTVGWRLIDQYLEGIRSVTPEDVRRVAAKYLVTDQKTTGILIPLKKSEGGA